MRRCVHEEAQTLRDLDAQGALREGRASCLERDADEEEREGRGQIGQAVDQEGQGSAGERGARQRDEEASDPWPDQRSDGVSGAVERRGAGHLRRRDDAGQGSSLRNVEEHEGGARHQRHSVEVGRCQAPPRGGQWDRAERRGARQVAADHHRFPVPAVDERPRREGKDKVGDDLHRGDEPRLRG